MTTTNFGETMKVKCIDLDTARSDGKLGRPSALTLGSEYVVAEILDTQFSIINDDMKIGRYSKIRFDVVDEKQVPSLRDNFNMLTLPMRNRIKDLEQLKGHNNG